MLKKLTLLAMAVAALVAFAVPAAAQASVQITNENNEVVPDGTLVTALSGNTETTGEGIVLSCEFVGITGEVQGSSLQNIEVTTPTPCLANGAPIAHIRASIAEINLNTGGTGVATTVTFESELTLVNRTCHFAGKGEHESVPLTYTETTLSIGGANNLVGKGEGCPGEAEIHGDFELFEEIEGKHVQMLSIDG